MCNKIQIMYSDDPDDESTDSETEEVDTDIIYSDGVDRVDSMLDDLCVGGNMGIYRILEHTFGDHVYQILHDYPPIEDPNKIFLRYMYATEYENFYKAMRGEVGTPMDDVVGLVVLFGKFFNIDDVNIPSFIAHVLLETCKPVRPQWPMTSHLIRTTHARKIPQLLS